MPLIQLTDEERAQVEAAAQEVGRQFNDLANRLRPAFEAIADQMARTIAPAVAFLRRVEEITAENRHAHRRDYRQRQLARRRRGSGT